MGLKLQTLAVSCVAALSWANVASADYAAPEGLVDKHDYATVDITTLNRWELTYVPEARKVPIFKQMFKEFQWRLYESDEQNDDCQQIHDQFSAWDGVAIIEPTLRANRYSDPVFKPWRDACPQLEPHMSEGGTLGKAYGTNHFKVFGTPSNILKDGHVFFYFQGMTKAHEIDRFGSLLGDDNGEHAAHLAKWGPGRNGSYRVIDLKTCSIAQALRLTPTGPFTYLDRSNVRVAESGVFAMNDDVYTVSWSYDTRINDGILSYYKLSDMERYLVAPHCVFENVK